MDVSKAALPDSSYSLLCSWASGRNEVRARGWHGQAMDKRVGECEDARDAAAEMAWNGAAIPMARMYLAGWQGRGRWELL